MIDFEYIKKLYAEKIKLTADYKKKLLEIDKEINKYKPKPRPLKKGDVVYDYDSVVKEYQRVVAAYNRLLSLVANEYAEKVSRSIFEEIDKTAKNNMKTLILSIYGGLYNKTAIVYEDGDINQIK